jgi:P4 family phage/plasmid primase-like protien
VSDKFLFDFHQHELERESAIDPAVIAERGYESVHRPTSGDQRQRDRLRRLGIPTWAIKEDSHFPGLIIPMFGPTGARVSFQWKPRRPVPNRDGKLMKYASPKGQTNRLDVHPRNRDKIVDPTVELWVTEGIKKGDALTSRGICVVSLTGVFNWRSTYGTLGDWEDVPLKGRVVTICFDADARTNANVQRAMVRLGRWLKSKGAKKIFHLIVPAEVNSQAVKGVDNFFAAGGRLDELKAGRTTTEPNPDVADDTFTDARLAETIADDVLTDRFIWVSGLGWLGWDGRRWDATTDVQVTDAVRLFALDRFAEATEEIRNGQGSKRSVDGWHSMLSAGRMRSVLALARGIVERKADDLDADADLLNTPSGVVDLQTGQLSQHNPDWLMTKITSGSYRPGFTHPDWDKALEALSEAEQKYLQVRMGQGATGHRTPDGVLLVLQGAGENGKSAITTDGVVPALGDYASMASPKLFQFTKGSEHSTERAELRGKRLLIAEELTEGRSIDVTALKQIQDVGMITARYVHKDNFTFQASHSLLTTTNYVPVVNETDHGTWRRLQLLKFPFVFRKPGQPLEGDTDRRGDPTLKHRIEHNTSNQHDAIVTWVVDGSVKWYANPDTALLPTTRVAADTRAWRADADRILGFWDERLIASDDHSILTTDMLDEFNRWLKSNGHNEWSKELFGPRFAQHTETVRYRVTATRTRQPGIVSRPPMALSPVPLIPRVYRGVRFQTLSDQAKHEECSESSSPSGNPSYKANLESFPNGRNARNTEPERTHKSGEEPTCGWCDRELVFEIEKRLQTCTRCQPVHGNFLPDDSEASA